MKNWTVTYTATNNDPVCEIKSVLFVNADTCMEAFEKAQGMLCAMKQEGLYSDFSVWAVNSGGPLPVEEDSNA